MFNFIKSKINIFDKKKNKKEENVPDQRNPIFRCILNQAEKNSSENIILFVKKILNLIEKRDFKKITELCASGLPDEIPLLRSLIWKINLGYLPKDINEWDNVLTDKREEYNYLKKAFSMKLHLEKKIYEENIKRQQNLDSNKELINDVEKMKELNIPIRSCRKFSEEKINNKDSYCNLFKIDKPKIIKRSESCKGINHLRGKLCLNINKKNFNDNDTNKKNNNNNLYSKIENIINKVKANNIKGGSNFDTNNNIESNKYKDNRTLNHDKKTEEIMDDRTIISNKDRELIEDIYKDMRRTYSDFQFFLRPSNKKANQINDKDIQNIIKRKSFNVSSLGFQTVVKEMNMEETHLDVIARILFIYSKTNTDLNYVQGMNEICALIYYVIVQEEDLKNKSNRTQIDTEILNNKINTENHKISEEDLDFDEIYCATESNITSNSSKLKEFLNFEDFILQSENPSINISEIQNESKKDRNQINYNIENINYHQNTSDTKFSGGHNHLKENYNFVLKTEVSDFPIDQLKNEKTDENRFKFSEFFNTDYESDTYWCFSYLMEMIKFNYMKSEDDKERGIFKKINLLKSALKSYDPSLHKLMEDKKIDIGIFTMRWFILLFCQDFTLPDVIRIWDILLFIDDNTDIFFKVYIFSLAILSLKKHYLNKYDYVSFIIEMQNLYDINIETLIDTYSTIHRNFFKKLKKIVK